MSRTIAFFSGLAGLGGALLLLRRSEQVAEQTADAVATGGVFKARITGYWPLTATEAERKMEGGVRDRKGKPLHTLERHLADPTAHPYVSVSGDDAIFPYGQRLTIDQWPSAVFRVVDTGGHFRGANKVYRIEGREPLDVCVESARTRVNPLATATIIKGDHFDRPGKELAVGKFKGQEIAVGLDCLGATEI